MNILFLYSELGPYNYVWFKELLKIGNNCLTVVFWDKDLLKPDVSIGELDRRIKWIPRSNLNKNLRLINENDWDIVYTSGWMDKGYLKLLLKLNYKVSVIGIDDMYVSSLKQKLLPFFGVIIKNFFTHAWTSGLRQYEYARRLGFKHNRIIHELLVPNSTFSKIKYTPEKKCFLYVGSMRHIKGVEIMIKAFENYRKAGGNWNLRLVGNNIDYDTSFFKKDGIIFCGAISNEKLHIEFQSSSAFIMPGLHEQWGVSLHEATLAGQPIICSSMVGSSSHLLINNYNGLSYESDINKLYGAMIKMSAFSSHELELMSSRSRKLALRMTPETSIANLLSIA